VGKLIIFNFHRYTWLIHRVANLCTNHRNLHMRDHKEKSNINIPLELAIDIISRFPVLQFAGAHAKENFAACSSIIGLRA
jgi:xylulose-5-phosphate/fructose-6-phosphate phosphoketolase